MEGNGGGVGGVEKGGRRERERVRGRILKMKRAVSLERVGIGRRDWYHRNQRRKESRTG